ncbi:RNA polymerase subunit sigma-70 [Streptomyces mirabilis]|nr:RNA polymerase subunit sigma-70 [Streptomyces mirabilis]
MRDGRPGQGARGDDAAFTRLVAPLRRELHAHCYRMLGSTHDADDALQEALLRAWRGLDRFEGRSSLRAWLYTVATRTCLDAVDRRGRRAMPIDLGPASDHAVVDATPLTEVAWLGPYPDAGLPAGPAARYEQREAVELAFVAAMQHLSGNQRAALLLFDVLGFSAAEIATMMDTSTTSVNSALARARRLLAERVPARSQQQTLRKLGDARVRETVTAFATALEAATPTPWSPCSPRTSPGRCRRWPSGTGAGPPSWTSPLRSRSPAARAGATTSLRRTANRQWPSTWARAGRPRTSRGRSRC